MASQYGVAVQFSAKTRELDAALNKLKGMDGVAAKLQGQLNKTGEALKKQSTSNAQLATQLRKLKGEYESLTQAAKQSAAAGGAGFDQATISKLRGLSTEINRTREAFISGKTAAAQYRKELDQLAVSASKVGRASRFSGIGKGAGAGIAAAGAFSGIPGFGAIAGGAAAGGAVGGPVGAAAGAAAAAIATAGAAAVSASKGIAIWYAQLNRSQIALEGVSNGTADFKASLEGLDRISKRLNVPIGEATQQFASLRASMAATGFSGADTLKVFENLAAANVALGGDAQQLQGILLATSQVFSKGKVSAEELRGQIGERLPGAFALFAEASGRTTAQLDKDLQEGKVSLDDFVKFADLAGRRFGASADKIAKSGTSAGDRLKQAWEDFSRVLGPILSAAGAAIQDFATRSLQAITPLLDGLARFFQLNRQGKNDRLYEVNQTVKRNEGTMSGLLGRTDSAAQARLAVLRRQTLNLKQESDRLTKELAPKIKPPTPTRTPTPVVSTSGDDGDGSSKGGKGDAERAAREAAERQRALADLNGQVALKEELMILDRQIFVELQKKNVATAAALEMEKILLERQEKIESIKRSDADAATKELEIKRATLEADERLGKASQDRQKAQSDFQQSFDDMLNDIQRQIELEGAGSEELRRQLEIQYQIEDINKGELKLTQDQIQALKDKNKELDKTKEKADAIKQQQAELPSLYDGIGSQIASGVGGAIDAVAGNVDNLGETLQGLAADILKAIGKMLIFYALSQAFGALGGGAGNPQGIFSMLGRAFGGGRASGGPVEPNTTYLVGEKGPELLEMGPSGGYVHSNDKMRGAMSRYSPGNNVSGGGGGGADPTGGGGGDAAAAEAPAQINISGGVFQYNDTSYIRQDQLPGIIDQASKMGESRTLRRLQMSPASRRKLGMA